METKNLTITYTHDDAVMDIDNARSTLEHLLIDGIFSHSQEEAEKELGAAYLMGRYENIQSILFGMFTQLGRAFDLLSREA